MKKRIISIFLLLICFQAIAYDNSLLTKKWQHTPFELYLTAQEAYDMKTANPEKVLLLDVRNQAELHYTGMPETVDANVPYRFDSSDWKLKKNNKDLISFKMHKNPDFVEAIENVLKAKGLTKESPVIIMCATGSRAPFATRLLHKAGFKEVHAQMEGFEGSKAKEGEHKGRRVVSGWKVSNLPWSYDLPAAKMYFNFAPER
ncbi:MAG: rhodanese-like domain-containing protein [Cocleimonas sp.]